MVGNGTWWKGFAWGVVVLCLAAGPSNIVIGAHSQWVTTSSTVSENDAARGDAEDWQRKATEVEQRSKPPR